MNKLLILVILSVLTTRTILAQTATGGEGADFYDLSLEELMNMKISVASVKALTTRESPGIVTLISEEEIKSSGARDLMEILNTIPGFDFAVDVEGVVGLGVRGNWAHEGKFLLLLDGQEMNENLFSSTQFGNHYPIENIKQIEIIRGPGSAIYGGFAEYAVINIITSSGAELQGIQMNVNSSLNAHGASGFRTAFQAGKKINDFSFSISGYSGITERSDRQYQDLDGNSFSMKGNSGIQNYYTNTSLDYKKFQFRFISDLYRLTNRDSYTNILSRAYEEHFDSYFFEVKKELKVSRALSFYPKIAYKRQLPWNFNGEPVNHEIDNYNIASEKISANLATGFDPSEKINIYGGVDWAGNRATEYQDSSFFNNKRQSITYFNQAAFLQSLFRLGFSDFTIGVRYNFSNQYNPSFVPRIGITRVFKKFHFKCLYSSAFRLPSTENINYGNEIQPEKTAVFEIEGGLLINDKMCFTLNAYSIRTSNTIIYYYDVYNETDAYKNYYGSGTQGFEMVYKIKDRWGWAELNYAYYNARNNFQLNNYKVPGNENVLLGLPAHKLNLKGSIKMNEHLNLSPSCSWESIRYGYVSPEKVKKYPAVFKGNLYLIHDHVFVDGLEVAIGIDNITNSAIHYIQPYNSFHAPLPGQSREYTIKLGYNLKL